MCPGSLITQISTWVETLTRKADSFCLCCFWQVDRHLCSLPMSGIPHHMDLHPGRNVYSTTCFILSVLFLTGGETPVVPTHVRDPPSHGPPPWSECLPVQLVHTVCVVFDRQWDVCGPYTCPNYTITQTSTPLAMSTCPAGSFCLCCFWQVGRHLWSLNVSGIPHYTDLYPSRNINPKSWFILSVLFFTGGEMSVVPTIVQEPPSHTPLPRS